MLVYSAPIQYRVLISSCADIVWQSILSGHVMENNIEYDLEHDLEETLRPKSTKTEAPTTTSRTNGRNEKQNPKTANSSV